MLLQLFIKLLSLLRKLLGLVRSILRLLLHRLRTLGVLLSFGCFTCGLWRVGCTLLVCLFRFLLSLLLFLLGSLGAGFRILSRLLQLVRCFTRGLGKLLRPTGLFLGCTLLLHLLCTCLGLSGRLTQCFLGLLNIITCFRRGSLGLASQGRHLFLLKLLRLLREIIDCLLGRINRSLSFGSGAVQLFRQCTLLIGRFFKALLCTLGKIFRNLVQLTLHDAVLLKLSFKLFVTLFIAELSKFRELLHLLKLLTEFLVDAQLLLGITQSLAGLLGGGIALLKIFKMLSELLKCFSGFLLSLSGGSDRFGPFVLACRFTLGQLELFGSLLRIRLEHGNGIVEVARCLAPLLGKQVLLVCFTTHLLRQSIQRRLNPLLLLSKFLGTLDDFLLF